MPEWKIRPMELSDLDRIEEIERLSFAMPWSPASFQRELTENPAARYLVLTEADAVVAYAGMWLVLDEGHVTNIAVHPDHRGKGYGKRITAALIQLAANLGMAWMTLEVRRSNAVAQSLYHRLGFIDVGYRKRYYEDNREDALVMALERLPEPTEHAT